MKTNMAPRLGGIKQTTHPSTSMWFVLSHCPKPRSEVRILMYRKWLIEAYAGSLFKATGKWQMRESSTITSNNRWTKFQLNTEIIDIVLQTFDATVKYLKVLVKWNWWWNSTCVCTISVNFDICLLELPWEIVFSAILGATIFLSLSQILS